MLTGSVAMLAAALDSAGDTLVSMGNFMVVRAAAKPADEGHPFGHGKLEHLASLFQSLLIGASGLFVVGQAMSRLGTAAAVSEPAIGLLVSGLAIGGALLITWRLKGAGRRLDSPALTADAAHYATDFIVNGGVLLAFVLDAWFGIHTADPILSVLISALIFRTAWRLFREASNALMDRALEEPEIEAIHGVVAGFTPAIHGYHDLIGRRAGSDRFVQIHLEIDAALSFREAHALVERVQVAISHELSGAQVTIHADPWPEDPEDLATHSEHGFEARLTRPGTPPTAGAEQGDRR
jgi:ferrous-iron efflux pump FieF